MASDPILSTFDRLVSRRPEAPLVASPRRHSTVEEVDRLARAVAERIGPLEPGTLVGLVAADGVAFLAGWLGLRRARSVPVLFDRRAPEAARQRIGGALDCGWTLTCAERWPAGAEAFELVRRRAVEAPAVLDPELGAIKLTSGSTGVPRGIATPTAALVADDAQLASTMGLRPDDRILAAIPFSHSYGLSSLVLPALRRGALLVLPDEHGGPYGPLRAARELGATFFPTVPAYLSGLVRMARPTPWPETLRLTITAGAVLPPETAARFRQIHGRPVHVFYGSSETGGIAYDREGDAGERGTVGTPVDGVRVTLDASCCPEARATPAAAGAVNGWHSSPSGPGVVVPENTGSSGSVPFPATGIVTVRSAAVASGYLGRGETGGDQRLHDGVFRSSDLARWDGDELRLAGRVDDLINVKGKKVNPREVEAVLAAMPGVRDVVAVAARAGGRGAVVRAVVAADRCAVDPRAVASWCRSRLAEHKVPRSVVVVDEVPRTARGKVDRPALDHLLSVYRPTADEP